jgi:hypothetical protein
MKISPDTLAVLKNFSVINQNILVEKGSSLITISQQKNNFARASVKEKFPVKFAIYALNEFLNAVSLFVDPDFVFEENFVTIQDEKCKASVRYFFADPTMIVYPQKKDVEFPKPEVSFELTEEDLDNVVKAASVLQVPNLVVSGKGGKISFDAYDIANNTSNGYSVTVGKGKLNFTAVFKKENLNMLKGQYTVEISSKGIAHFKNNSIDLEYYTSLEQNSKFEGETKTKPAAAKPATKKASNGSK